MGIFDKAKDAVENAVDEHGDKIKDGVDKAADVVDDKTGGKYTDKIEDGKDNVTDALGLDQDKGPA